MIVFIISIMVVAIISPLIYMDSIAKLKDKTKKEDDVNEN